MFLRKWLTLGIQSCMAAEAANVYRLTVRCHTCGKPIELRTDGEDAQELLKYCVMMEMDHIACSTTTS
jgi:hypothetical protein